MYLLFCLLQKGQIPKPFLIPEHHIFRPPAAKVQNVQGVDYLGQAKVLSELVVPDSEAKKGRVCITKINFKILS